MIRTRHGIACPVCTASHPTGRYTQTFAGVTHRSREYAGVARAVNVSLLNVHDPEWMALLRAAKERLEGEGCQWCERCGSLVDAEAEQPLCLEHVEFWGDSEQDNAQEDDEKEKEEEEDDGDTD